MSPAAWIAIGGIVIGLIVQTVGLAFWLGGMSARMRNIEGRPHDGDCKAELAAMTATLAGFKEAVTGRIGALEEMVKALVTSPRARRSTARD